MDYGDKILNQIINELRIKTCKYCKGEQIFTYTRTFSLIDVKTNRKKIRKRIFILKICECSIDRKEENNVVYLF